MGAKSPWIIDVTEADFMAKVIEPSKTKPVVVDFWASWCQPCVMLAPLLEKLTLERGGEVVLAKVDVQENQNLAMEFRAESIPMVLAFRNGEVVLGFNGLLPEEQLREFFNKIVPSEADRAAERAKELESSDPAVAEGIYRKTLESEPGHMASLLGLASVLAGRGEDEEVQTLLDRVPPGGETGAEAERIRSRLSLQNRSEGLTSEAALREKVQQNPDDPQALFDLGSTLAAAGTYAEALETLLSAAKLDREFAKAKVREAMVQIFNVIGARSEMSDEYRDKLSKVLY